MAMAFGSKPEPVLSSAAAAAYILPFPAPLRSLVFVPPALLLAALVDF